MKQLRSGKLDGNSMMKSIYLLVLTVFLVSLLCCSPAVAPESTELDQQVQIEAGKFEELLTDLSKNVSKMTYPKDIPLKPVIPDSFNCPVSSGA